MKIRFILMLAFLVLGSIGWVIGWNYLSGEADKAFKQALATANQGGRQVSCGDQYTSGFPFRLGLHCETPRLIDADGTELDVAGLHAQAFVYRPMHQVVDFKSPARLKSRRFGALQLSWEEARFGSSLQTNGLKAATARMESARLQFIDPPVEIGNTSIVAKSAMISARRGENEEPQTALVMGIITDGLAVLGEKYRLPAIALQASVLAHDMAPVLSGVDNPMRFWIENGGEADIQHIEMRSGNAQLFVKGWFKLDQNGFVNADLDIDSINLFEFVDGMGPELIQIQSILRAVIGTMEGLGQPTTLGDRPAKRVKMSIRNGFVKVGIIPLGSIPQLDLSVL